MVDEMNDMDYGRWNGWEGHWYGNKTNIKW